MRKIHVPLRNTKGKSRGKKSCCSNTCAELSHYENRNVLLQGLALTVVFGLTYFAIQFSTPDLVDYWGSYSWNNVPVTLPDIDASTKQNKDGNSLLDSDCVDPLWCSIPMPKKSVFGFPPPTDLRRWKQARLLAKAGEQVLLREISKVITNPFDFLDGDPFFRRLHYLTDVFVDEEKWLAPLTRTGRQHFPSSPPGSSSGVEGVKTSAYQRIPVPYNFSVVDRIPIVQIGYSILNKNNNAFFSGDRKGVIKISRKLFLQEWSQIRSEINTKFIAIVLTDPDWGWLSSYVKGRTQNLGSCCKEDGDEHLIPFLEDPNLVMLVVNQHSNIQHRKIVTFPRGLPTKWEHNERLMFDSMRLILANIKKDKLLKAPKSNWKDSKLAIYSLF